MRLFGFGGKKIGGVIGYFGLEDWWLSAFSEEERRHIREIYHPLGGAHDPLTSGNISYTSQSALSFLSNMAGWFYRPHDRPIAHKIIAKAQEYAAEAPVLDRHFMCQAKLELYYKDRDQPQLLGEAIAACLDQIRLAPEAAEAFRVSFESMRLPSHRGYEQLAIILEKQKKYEDTINLCTLAADQGWSGDWQKRIERCRKKLAQAR